MEEEEAEEGDEEMVEDDNHYDGNEEMEEGDEDNDEDEDYDVGETNDTGQEDEVDVIDVEEESDEFQQGDDDEVEEEEQQQSEIIDLVGSDDDDGEVQLQEEQIHASKPEVSTKPVHSPTPPVSPTAPSLPSPQFKPAVVARTHDNNDALYNISSDSSKTSVSPSPPPPSPPLPPPPFSSSLPSSFASSSSSSISLNAATTPLNSSAATPVSSSSIVQPKFTPIQSTTFSSRQRYYDPNYLRQRRARYQSFQVSQDKQSILPTSLSYARQSLVPQVNTYNAPTTSSSIPIHLSSTSIDPQIHYNWIADRHSQTERLTQQYESYSQHIHATNVQRIQKNKQTIDSELSSILTGLSLKEEKETKVSRAAAAKLTTRKFQGLTLLEQNAAVRKHVKEEERRLKIAWKVDKLQDELLQECIEEEVRQIVLDVSTHLHAMPMTFITNFLHISHFICWILLCV